MVSIHFPLEVNAQKSALSQNGNGVSEQQTEQPIFSIKIDLDQIK